MTREEARESIKEAYGNSEYTDEIIKALEQEPSEDAISRQAVLDLVNADWKYEGLEEDVSSLPPVTPQPKKGYWIYKQYGGYPEQGDYHCSKCDNIDNRTPAYCPYCGQPKMLEYWR